MTNDLTYIGERDFSLPYMHDNRKEMLMRNRKIMLILTLGFLVGISLLLYPAVSDYWNSKTQSRVIDNYESVLQKIEPEDYSHIFEDCDMNIIKQGGYTRKVIIGRDSYLGMNVWVLYSAEISILTMVGTASFDTSFGTGVCVIF